MSKKTTLLRHIERFLSERKQSTGGYAPVEPEEVQALQDIIHRLIELKYEKDPDGDLPLEATLTDRTRYERPLHLPVPYAHKPTDGRSQLELHLQASERYASLSHWAADSSKRHLQSATVLMHQATQGHRPLQLGGVRYIVKAPEHATPELAQAELAKLASAEYKRNPCPVDFNQRQQWMARIGEKASQKLGFKVTPTSCMHTTTGVRMFVEVPALDTVIKVETSAALVKRQTKRQPPGS